MKNRIIEALNGKESNYLFPLCWQHGDHTDDLVNYVRRVYDSGCRAMCIESRPHRDFVKDGWWRDLDIILLEAKKLDMKVWVFDDEHCPTGRAAGLIKEKYPHLRQWEIVERHVDVVGPMKSASFILDKTSEDHILLGAYAYRRHRDEAQQCEYEAIDITATQKDGFVFWDIPEGTWRIYFYYKTREGGLKDFLDTINPESTDVLIEAVYEPHYKHYAKYFGNTFVGFFTDEPCFGNGFRYGEYDMRAGKQNFPFPWSETVYEMMKSKLGYDPMPHMNLLWYEDDSNGNDQSELRYAYMDAVTRLYSENFTKRLSDWCHAHGVMYIGHIIEEISLSCGAGHFFRAMQWQDMSGIDIVLNQILPGMHDYYNHISADVSVWGSKFYHYVLAKLGASLAHIEEKMQGRAFCEVFGAYGWAEDTTIMKFLVDFLLVRGINHFMPHAFDSHFPDPEFPPHFGFKDHDPSYDAIATLMNYTNKAAHILSGTTHVSGIAILYDEDLHWTCRNGTAMLIHNVAKALYDEHFDYDIIPYDYLDRAVIQDKKMYFGKEEFKCLIIPHADHIAEEIQEKLYELKDAGIKIYFIDALPENAAFDAEVVKLSDISEKMSSLSIERVIVKKGYELLRIYHAYKEKDHVFMLANEDVKTIETTVTLPVSGDCIITDLASDITCSAVVECGKLNVKLEPRQSILVIFTDNSGFEKIPTAKAVFDVNPQYKLELAESGNLTSFVDTGSYNEFFSITGIDFKPDFSGKMRYTFEINTKIPTEEEKVFLDLGEVGQNAELCVNGIYSGIRFSKPYIFNITDLIKSEKTEITVTVSNTPVQKLKDRFSARMVIAPSGLLGGIKLKYCTK